MLRNLILATVAILLAGGSVSDSLARVSTAASHAAAIRRADVVVLARIERVMPSPGALSGCFALSQGIEYTPLEVLTGELPDGVLRVGHLLVFDDRTCEPETAELSKALFVPGRDVLLFLNRTEAADLAVPQLEGLWKADYVALEEDFDGVSAYPQAGSRY